MFYLLPIARQANDNNWFNNKVISWSQRIEILNSLNWEFFKHFESPQAQLFSEN